MILCEIDPVGATSTLEKALAHSWEAGLVVLVVVAIGGLFVWLMRQQLSNSEKREERMAKRIDVLEDFQRKELSLMLDHCRSSLDANSAAMEKLNTTLSARPCLWQVEHQQWIMSEQNAKIDKLQKDK